MGVEMRNISDLIEKHLKMVLEQSKEEYIEIQRSEVADKFQCVPSQINYVINTRFTLEKGYLVESKRGGGGFIRIRKIKLVNEREFLETLLEYISDEIPQQAAEAIITRLTEAKVITQREARIMNAVMNRNILAFNVQIRDQLRAKLLYAMISTLMYK